MKKVIAAALLLLACLPALALPQDAAPDPLAYLGWLKDLAGACWQGTGTDGRETDRQCYEIQYGRFLRGTIEMAGPGGGKFAGDSLYHRDAKAGRIAVVTWASNGVVATAEAVVEGALIVFPAPKVEGRAERRFVWSRRGDDAFSVAREVREGEAWKVVQRVDYRRVK